VDMADSEEGDGLVPSRRAGRRVRRRPTSVPGHDAPDPMAAVLATLMALQSTNDALVAEVREVRRRLTTLTNKIETLNRGQSGTEPLGRLRSKKLPNDE